MVKTISLRFIPFILFLTVLQTTAMAQIVNVESLRKQTDTTGFAGSIELDGSYLDNEKVIYTVGLETDIQYKWECDIFTHDCRL